MLPADTKYMFGFCANREIPFFHNLDLKDIWPKYFLGATSNHNSIQIRPIWAPGGTTKQPCKDALRHKLLKNTVLWLGE